jgi:DNA-binding transcriptional LysR family regulator
MSIRPRSTRPAGQLPPKPFDFNLLPLAVAVYDAGSVTQAARTVGMSQAALSMALRKLRAQVGDALFIRSARGMVPTPRCRALVTAARPLIAKVYSDVLLEQPFDPTATRRVFTFALSDVGEMVFLPPILDRLRRVAPHASVRSVTLPPRELERELEHGDVDLAIGYFPDLKRNQFFAQRLFTHEFCCLLRAGHPIQGDRLTLKQFQSAEHAVVRAQGRSQEVFEQYLQRHRIKRRVALLTPHFMSIPMIVARSDLIATVPHAIGLWFARFDTKLRIVRPPFRSPRFDLKQLWHRRYHEDLRSRWLRSIIADLFNDATDEWKAR